MPAEIFGNTLAMVGRVLYSFGGSKSRSRDVYRFNMNNNTWSMLAEQLSVTMNSPRVVVYNMFEL